MATQPQPQTIQVRVTALLDESDAVTFTQRWQKDGDSVWKTGPIQTDPGTGPYRLEFELKDRSGKNLEFYDDPADAAWFNVDVCPKGKYGSDDKGQITSKTVKGSDELHVRDLNSGAACDLHYALRFDGDAGTDAGTGAAAPPYVYDPILKNRGGGPAFQADPIGGREDQDEERERTDRAR